MRVGRELCKMFESLEKEIVKAGFVDDQSIGHALFEELDNTAPDANGRIFIKRKFTGKHTGELFLKGVINVLEKLEAKRFVVLINRGQGRMRMRSAFQTPVAIGLRLYRSCYRRRR